MYIPFLTFLPTPSSTQRVVTSNHYRCKVLTSVLTRFPPALLLLLLVLVTNVVGVTTTTNVVVDTLLLLLLVGVLKVVGAIVTTNVLVVVPGTVNGEFREVDVDVGVVTVTPPLAPGPLIKAADAETQSKSVQP